jgi:methyl-accepting chemotaxis protein
MSEIRNASVEQTSGIEQVNQAIGQMDEVTQQNAALVEQAAAAAESLEEQAENLSATVGRFTVDSGFSGLQNVAPVKQAVNKKPIASASSGTRPATPKPKVQASGNEDWEEF